MLCKQHSIRASAEDKREDKIQETLFTAQTTIVSVSQSAAVRASLSLGENCPANEGFH